MNRANAILALAFAVFLAVGETVRNWGNWQWWPFWLVDFIAAALLAWGGVIVLRGLRGGGAILAGAWGFATAMFYSSFWAHIATIDEPVDGNFAARPLTTIIGILWVITVVGFVLSLASAWRERGARDG